MELGSTVILKAKSLKPASLNGFLIVNRLHVKYVELQFKFHCFIPNYSSLSTQNSHLLYYVYIVNRQVVGKFPI